MGERDVRLYLLLRWIARIFVKYQGSLNGTHFRKSRLDAHVAGSFQGFPHKIYASFGSVSCLSEKKIIDSNKKPSVV